MRAVHVASGRLFGGIEQMLVTMARERDVTADVAATFAVASPGRLEDELRSTGVALCPLGDVRLSRPASVIIARSRLARLLMDVKADAVICHAPWSYAIFAPVARRRAVSTVLWQHDRADGRSFVERWAAQTTADLVICNSAWTARTATALQPAVPIAVIHPPVALPTSSAGTREQLRQDLGGGPGDVVILSASRLEPWKGHMNLLRALGCAQAKRPWMLWIAGAAARPHEVRYVEDLKQEVARLGLAVRVQFIGERRDVPQLMRAADLFCQANDGPEPFGVVFAEALLSGVPVVTTDAGGAPEIVSDECGRLVPVGDVEALARVLADLIDDDTLRARLGARGPAHAAARCAPAIVLPQLARELARLGERPTA